MSDDNNKVISEVGEMSDEEIVSYTQRTRKKLVDHITGCGNNLPTDKGEQMVLLAALGDMDRTALGKMKIGAKERQGAADSAAAALITKLFTTYGSTSPFEKKDGVIEGEVVKTPQLDDTSLPPLQTVPGETEVGLSTENYEQFMQRMESGKQPE